MLESLHPRFYRHVFSSTPRGIPRDPQNPRSRFESRLRRNSPKSPIDRSRAGRRRYPPPRGYRGLTLPRSVISSLARERRRVRRRWRLVSAALHAKRRRSSSSFAGERIDARGADLTEERDDANEPYLHPTLAAAKHHRHRSAREFLSPRPLPPLPPPSSPPPSLDTSPYTAFVLTCRATRRLVSLGYTSLTCASSPKAPACGARTVLIHAPSKQVAEKWESGVLIYIHHRAV